MFRSSKNPSAEGGRESLRLRYNRKLPLRAVLAVPAARMRVTRPALWLGGTALVAVALLAPISAKAANLVDDGFGNVTIQSATATTNTFVINGTGGTGSDREHEYSNGDNIQSTIGNFAITGAGLTLVNTSAGATVSLTNSSSISNSVVGTLPAASGASTTATVSLLSSNGVVTYSGSGSITNSSGTGAALATSSGTAETDIDTGTGTISAAAGSTQAIVASSTSGNINITTVAAIPK